MLNLGCGTRFHVKWHNMDFSPVNKFVQKANLLEVLFPALIGVGALYLASKIDLKQLEKNINHVQKKKEKEENKFTQYEIVKEKK